MEVDITLLAAARKMDRDALTEIFELYATPLYKYAFRLCNDAVMADQIVGDVFAKLMEHLLAGLGPRANLRPYLFEVAYHLFVDELRYVHRSAPIDVVDLRYSNGYSTQISVEEECCLRLCCGRSGMISQMINGM